MTQPIEILLVEDSPTDQLIAVEALRQARILNSLNVVDNGVEAMAYLRREGKYSGARRPSLVLLDLNLPRKDGREVLKEIKEDPVLKFIPVVVLTTSKADEDLVRVYGYHANSYITKPVDFPRFTEVIRSIENYWFEVVSLPSEAALERFVRAEAAPAASGTLGMGATVRVLLAEDSPADLVLIRDALGQSALAQFEITAVERLSQARAKLASERFDVILTDLGLPDSQGLETFRQMRTQAPHLPIVVLTGLDDETMGVSALREGAQEYVAKGAMPERSLGRALRYAIERKGIETRLHQAQRMEAIGLLAAGVAHDFNNILTVIQGRANLLLLPEAEGSEGFLESAREIQAAAERAATLTRQLLTFSRKQAMQPQPLDVSELVGNFVKMLRRVLGEDIRLELKLASLLPPVEADVGMLEQVVLNLAVNARDAMPSGGKLSLQSAVVELTPEEARQQGDAYAGTFVRLSVSDTGSGMRPEILKRIFEPFFTTKEVGKGTGLGLATVFGIVQQHRGWIAVRSEPGAGTTFEVHLPVSQRRPGKPPVVAPPAIRTGTETILLVEDEETVRQVARMILRKQGYRIIEADSGVAALRAWQDHRGEIRLVVTDMVMPEGKTGRQLAEELKAADPSIKVIFTSGYSQEFTSGDFPLEEGVNFLQKPYDLNSLIKIVRQALDRP